MCCENLNFFKKIIFFNSKIKLKKMELHEIFLNYSSLKIAVIIIKDSNHEPISES